MHSTGAHIPKAEFAYMEQNKVTDHDHCMRNIYCKINNAFKLIFQMCVSMADVKDFSILLVL